LVWSLGSPHIPAAMPTQLLVYILGPSAKLRVQRSERLFFHPTTMTSQMLPDYAESLRRKTAQLADVVEVFGMFRDSA
jgi:hypothetical protein